MEKETRQKEIFQKRKEREVYRDKIRGGLFGGAVGDALGYPVEFLPESEIRKQYGEAGIQNYELDAETGMALISDDTQMSLFTANGILFGDTKECLQGIQAEMSSYVYDAYQDWLATQLGSKKEKVRHSWLFDIPELHHRRAPGATCMNALRSGRKHFEDEPINHSKGCGGIMRVAPLGLHYHWSDRKRLDREGAAIATLTHGHPLGYMPAAMLTHIVNLGVYGGCELGDTLEDAVQEAMNTVSELYAGEPYLPRLRTHIDRAIALSKNEESDSDNIRAIGEGWVAEETLAIAVYCSLRYPKDFSKAVIAAVNHNGDSDSTGAVTGNILGAWLGYEAMEEKWKKNLELSEIILEMADDLCYGCLVSEDDEVPDPAWIRKYVRSSGN